MFGELWAKPSAASSHLGARCVILLTLFCIEVVSLHAPYTGEWNSDTAIAHKLVVTELSMAGYLLCAVAAFFMAAWPHRRALFARWRSVAEDYSWRLPTIAGAVLTALLAAGTIAARHTAIGAATPLWLLVGTWSLGFAAMLVLFVLSFAPIGFWRSILSTQRLELLIALAVALFVWMVSALAQSSWGTLSDGTLRLSHWLLDLYESDVHADLRRRLLGAGNFTVEIAPECSGYEGIGLVLGFLAVYAVLFRSKLRFPNFFALFPAAALAIWLLNGVRIALLVSIGAHLSPGMAVHGFHSQAGVLMFLGVAIGMMVGVQKVPFFRADHTSMAAIRHKSNPAHRKATAYLLPFAILMIGNLVSTMFLGYGQWVFAFEALILSALMWSYRDIYGELVQQVSLVAVTAGLLVGALWVWTEPSQASAGTVDVWMASLPPWAAGLWVALRIAILVIFVPLGEELAFRGYLHRALIARHFEQVEPGLFTWPAFLVSTLLFALLHSRWQAALGAAAVYALLMYRSNRLSDPIAAHALSNAVIAGVALATHRWSLL